MSDLQQATGLAIREERRQRGLTAKELATKASISIVYLGEIERGAKYPSPQVLERIAGALEIEVADLLELVADRLRADTPEVTRDAIGFRLPNRGELRSRVTARQLVRLLEPEEIATISELGTFLLARRSGLIPSDTASED